MMGRESKLEDESKSSNEFAHRDGAVLVKKPGQVNGDSFVLKALKNCEVVVADLVGQVTVEGLADCKVFLGPCTGSIFVRDCRGCTFTVITKQLRVLGCQDCFFFVDLHGTGDPVIEQSNELYFGRYNGPNDSKVIGTLKKHGGFDAEPTENWKNVFDFSSDGKHWDIISEGQSLLDVRTGRHSPLGLHLLREVFWKFDSDRDGALSFTETNNFQQEIGSDEALKSTADMIEMFEKVGIPLDDNGNLPFSSFVKLYEMQGEDDLHQDLTKLGFNRKQVRPFNLELYLEDEAGKPVEGGPVDESSFEDDDDDNWDVVDAAMIFFLEASRRGVNLQKWFGNYDNARAMTMSRAEFETAFSALLLGLCAGSSDEFTQNVERILDPRELGRLCDLFADPNEPGNVRYMSLILRARTRQNANNISMFSQKSLLFETTTEAVDIYLGKKFSNEVTAEGKLDLFERIRVAVQEWKWSEAGRIPTRSGGERQYITCLNLRGALKASIRVDFTMEQILKFAELLEANVESLIETRARYRYQLLQLKKINSPQQQTSPTPQEGSGSDEEDAYEDDDDEFEDEEEAEEEGEVLQKRLLSSNVDATPGAASPSATVSIRDYPITVAAIMRFLGQMRLAKTIDRGAWLSAKREDAKRTAAKERNLVNEALSGDSQALHLLTKGYSKAHLDKILIRVLALPDWAVESEARGIAEQELVKDPARIRKRAVLLAMEEDPEEEGMEMTTTMDMAREAIFQELMNKAAESLAHQGKIDLFLEFAKGREMGTISSSFEEWIGQRDEERKRKKQSLKRWERTKRITYKSRNNDQQYVALACELFAKMRDLVNKTYKQQKDEKSGFLVCRSSRYNGLDVEHAISSFVKLKTDEAIQSSVKSVDEMSKESAAIAVGDILITQKEFHDHFEGVLTSLTADPSTSEEAMVLLDPLLSSEHKVRAFVATKEGKKRIQNLMDELTRSKKLSANVAKAESKQIIRAEIEDQLLSQVGFHKPKSEQEATEIVEESRRNRREKADSEFNRWLKQKRKLQRQQKKEARQQAKLKQKQDEQRHSQSAREYRRWKQAIRKGAYVTYKPASSATAKPKRVLKPRPKPQFAASEFQPRPAWDSTTVAT